MDGLVWHHSNMDVVTNCGEEEAELGVKALDSPVHVHFQPSPTVWTRLLGSDQKNEMFCPLDGLS